MEPEQLVEIIEGALLAAGEPLSKRQSVSYTHLTLPTTPYV